MAKPTFKLIGDWQGPRQLFSNIKRQMTIASKQGLEDLGRAGEKFAVTAVQGQTLGWAPLSVNYAAYKQNRGLSEKILVASSSYYQAITSWVSPDGRRLFVGVRRTARSADGAVLADIAKVHEYGSLARRLPARPLWRPTNAHLKELVKSNNPIERRIRQRLRNSLRNLRGYNPKPPSE